MKISEIHLNKFRSHLKTEIKGLGKFVVFLGKNGVGKSTILDAISYALTGLCRGVDEGGRGGDMLLSRQANGDGPKRYGVTLATDKLRIVRGSGEGPRAKVQVEISQKLGLDSLMARALVQTGVFLRLPQTQQRSIVLSVTQGGITNDEAYSLLGHSPGELDLGDLTTIAAIEAAEKEARAARPELKRQLAAIVLPDAPPKAANGDLDATLQALNEAHAERDAIISKSATRNGRIKSLRDALQAARAAPSPLATADPSKVTGALQPVQIKSLEKELGELEAQEATATASLAAARANVEAMQARLDTLRRQYRTVEAIKGACPTCQRPLAGTEATAAVNCIKNEGSKVSAELRAQQKTVDDLSYDTKRVARVREIRESLRTNAEAAATIAAVKVREEERAATIKRLEAELKTLGKPEEPDTRELDADISKGEAFLRDIREAEAAAAAWRSATEQKSALEKRLTLYDDLVEKLGPKGPLRAKLMGGGLADFVGEVSAVAVKLGLGEVVVQTDPWLISAGGYPAALLSSSEEYRLSLAFAAVLAKRSGAGILVLDGAEILDGDNRAAVNDALEAAGLDQAILAATTDDIPDGAGRGDWSLFWVEKRDGVSSVGRIGAAITA